MVMIPVGYMVKSVSPKPDYLKADQVADIYSVSNCISSDFADYINYWKHNGYWLFDSPEIIREIATEHQININNLQTFFYEAYELQYDETHREWQRYTPEPSFKTKVIIPMDKQLKGFDIVSFFSGNAPECSPLSCNHMAEVLKVNHHCLLETVEEAITLLETGAFENCEPGPYRLFAVYTVKTDDGPSTDS